jgi:hypothetical protein
MIVSEEWKPAEVFPLAEYISEELEARRWTTTDAALRMGDTSEKGFTRNLMSLDLLMCVQSDKLVFDDALLGKLSTVFGVSAQFFRNLDTAWRQWPDRRADFTPPDSIFGPVSRRSIIRLVPSA